MSDWSLRISPYPAYSHSSISSFFTWAEAADRVDDPSLSSSKKSLRRTAPLVGSHVLLDIEYAMAADNCRKL